MFDNSQTYKPENALKRAEELIAQDQPLRALNALHDVISNRRSRMWQACLEDIMLKHIDLCVELRKGKYAKDGLIQFRSICQQVNVASLEKVIGHFLDESEAKAKEAQASSEDVASHLTIQDLEAEGETMEEAPETVMMKAVCGETTKDRTDREILMPWIKFLWESYRTSLDVTRTNPKLELIYHDTAKKAFGFCQRYQRKMEYRRLCDLVRTHHQQQCKYPEQRASILQSPDSFTRYMETRFKQLQVGTHLDLWQEAYRSIEDIHGIITFFKKTPPIKQSIEYFDKLMKVFWVAKNYLFHAYACIKYHNYAFTLALKGTKKEVSAEDAQTVASKVLLAVLCIPFWDRQNSSRQKDELFTLNLNREKNSKITNLLGSTTIPTRSSLLLDMQNRKVVEQVFPPLQELYNLLEVTFSPLTLCHHIPAVVEFLNTKAMLKPYVEILQRVAAVRMIEQVCKMYDTMRIEDFCRLCPYYTFFDLEPLLLEVSRSGYPSIHLTINHHTQTINFTDMQMNCDSLSGQLALLNRKLEPVVNQCLAAGAPPKQPVELSPQYFLDLTKQLNAERNAILARQRVIEDLKERQEQLEAAKAREMEAEKKQKQELLEKSERKRIEEEAAQREVQRQKQREQEEAEQQSRALFTEIVQQKGAAHLRKAVKENDSIVKDQDRLVEEAKKLLAQAREEREKRQKDEQKRLDYFERACREEERVLLQKVWQEKIEQERESMAQNYETSRENHRKTWQKHIAEKTRLGRMQEDWDRFRAEVLAARAEKQRQKSAAEQDRAQQMQQPKEDEADEDEGEDEEEEEAAAAPSSPVQPPSPAAPATPEPDPAPPAPAPPASAPAPEAGAPEPPKSGGAWRPRREGGAAKPPPEAAKPPEAAPTPPPATPPPVAPPVEPPAPKPPAPAPAAPPDGGPKANAWVPKHKRK